MKSSRCNSMLVQLKPASWRFASVALALLASMGSHATTASPLRLPSQDPRIQLAQRTNIAKLVQEADQIIGLEAIVAASTDDAFYSRFGHAMLRFVKADGNYATDMVVSLIADADMSQLNVTEATFGGYTVLPLIKPLGGYWEEYVQTQERPLSRYVIVSTPEQRENLIRTLQDWIAHPEHAGTYTFINNNCVGALAKLLEKAGFPRTSVIDPRIPVHLDRWLTKSLLAPFPPLFVDSSKELLAQTAQLLKISVPNLLGGKDWPSDAAATIEAQFNDLQIKRLLLQLSVMPSSVRDQLLQSHRFGNGGANYDEAMSFKVVAPQIYQLCQDRACIHKVAKQAAAYWSSSDWQEAMQRDDFALWLANGGNQPSDVSDQQPRPNHLKTRSALYLQMFLEEVGYAQ